MFGTLRSVCVVSLAAAGLGFSTLPVRAQDSNGTSSRSVHDGVYSKEQAASGKETFLNICAACHTSGQFRGQTFQRAWEGRSADDLFQLLRSTMPQDNPGGLSTREYVSVIAYIFELNGFPAGSAQLPADAAALRLIRLEPKPAGS